jgi:hypothetical protein
LSNFFNPGPFARSVAIAAVSRVGACWRSRLRVITLVLIASLCANSVGQEPATQPKRDALSGLGLKSQTTLAIAGMTVTLSLIGVGVYAIIQHAHTVRGCVSDSPDGLMLHTEDGKAFVLLGNTTNIKADTRIKVRGTKKKKIDGITNQPSFVVEKLGKVYSPCSVAPAAP